MWWESTEVLPGVWLGDELGAKSFGGATVSVHEAPHVWIGTHHVPIMTGSRGDADCPACQRGSRLRRHLCSEHFDAESFHASRDMLNAATSIMRHYQRLGVPVMVHCAQGIERSPLTMAWFLKRYGHEKSLPAAYARIQMKRPIVQERTQWLSHP